MYYHKEELMLSCKHEAEVGGCFVIKHQTEETMAAILLAWAGEERYLLTKSLSSSETSSSLSEGDDLYVFLLPRKRSLCFS